MCLNALSCRQKSLHSRGKGSTESVLHIPVDEMEEKDQCKPECDELRVLLAVHVMACISQQ